MPLPKHHNSLWARQATIFLPSPSNSGKDGGFPREHYTARCEKCQSLALFCLKRNLPAGAKCASIQMQHAVALVIKCGKGELEAWFAEYGLTGGDGVTYHLKVSGSKIVPYKISWTG